MEAERRNYAIRFGLDSKPCGDERERERERGEGGIGEHRRGEEERGEERRGEHRRKGRVSFMH